MESVKTCLDILDKYYKCNQKKNKGCEVYYKSYETCKALCKYRPENCQRYISLILK